MNADRLALLEKLFRLKSNGAITEDEFRAEKAKVLGVGERSEADVPETRPSAKRRWRTPVLLAAFSASGLLAAMAATGTREAGNEALERLLLPRYPGCDTPDIVLPNGQRWAACNVGASKAYAGQKYPSDTEPTEKQKVFMGAYFQWGRNDEVTPGIVTSVLAPAGTVGNA